VKQHKTLSKKKKFYSEILAFDFIVLEYNQRWSKTKLLKQKQKLWYFITNNYFNSYLTHDLLIMVHSNNWFINTDWDSPISTIWVFIRIFPRETFGSTILTLVNLHSNISIVFWCYCVLEIQMKRLKLESLLHLQTD
jgi:hypothetical protein